VTAKPKVSVALCTYNGARFIEAQLESILWQSWPPDEVIVSDDGSQDQTLEIVRRIANQHPSVVRLVKTPGRLGYAKNFEFAIQRATGDIIFLSDQDDVWLDHKVERMLAAFAESERVAVVYCDAQLVDGELRPLGRSVFQSRASMRLATRRLALELVHGVDIGVLGSMMALRASLRAWVLPIEEVWGHDHWIVFIAHAMAEVRAVGEPPLMYYRRHHGNTGFDINLDGGKWKDWMIGASIRGIEPYVRETHRWRVMVDRLKWLKASGASAHNEATLDEFIWESERRLEFTKARESLKRRTRPRRVKSSLRLLLHGDYHFYVHGFRSFCKDLLMR
jgi:glycosyltransferase involved in cell wall biosynthesis